MSDRRPTILVVDDHSDLRDALVVLLEHEGYRVADASNGAEALDYLRSGAPVNALIVDLDMPVMNGWDFLAEAYVFGSENGTYQPNIQTGWETLRLLAYGYEPRTGKKGAEWNREQLQRIDLHWHDLRHEGACRLLADGVDIRMIQLMLGHASIQQTQRYLNVTDEELRRGLEVSWNNKGRPLRLASGA